MFFVKAKQITEKLWLPFYYHIFLRGSKNSGAMFLSAQNSFSVRRFLLDNNIFFLTLITVSFLLPDDILNFYKEEKYKCLLSKKHYQLIKFTRITSDMAQRRKLIFRHNKSKNFLCTNLVYLWQKDGSAPIWSNRLQRARADFFYQLPLEVILKFKLTVS